MMTLKNKVPGTLAMAAFIGMISFPFDASADGDAKGLEISAGFANAADSLSMLYIGGSYYRGQSKIINYFELNYASELFSLFITDHPTVKKFGMYVGHRFQARWKFLALPTAIGFSSGAGVDRGEFLRSVKEDSTCIFCAQDDYYEKRKYVSAGVFLEMTPGIYINGFHFGLKTMANYDTRYLAYGAGLSFSMPLEIFEPE
jgi:hypothetical protein